MIDIALCMVVRNDLDILRYNLIYHYNIGFRNFYILQHKAIGNQELKLEGIAFELENKGCNFFITRHDKDEHYHDKDIKILVDKAREDGFNWCCGIDSDEIIRLKKHNTIQELISEYDDKGPCELRFQWFEHRPLKNVYPPDNAFLEFNRRNIAKREQSKAIGKFDDKMLYCAGVHLIHHAPIVIEIPFEDAYYSHFPDRNVVQFVEKYEIQHKNWMERYGQFPLHEHIIADPWFLYKHWENTLKLQNEEENIIDQVEGKYFEI
jgi:hypothetical protein